MRLFHAISIYQLMICIVLNLRHPTDKKTVCLLPDFIIRKFPAYKKLEECHVFDHVILYPYAKIPVPYTVDTLADIGDSIYEKVVPYSLDEFEEIYCAATQFAFAAYLSWKQVPFFFIEDGSGTFLGMKRFKGWQKRVSYTLWSVGEELGLIDASNPLIKRIYADFPKETKFDDSRVIRCNLVEELRQLPESYIQILRKVFGAEDIVIPNANDSLLFLTQHPANLKLLTMEGQKNLVTLTVDYYLKEKNLVIKPHPDDILYNQRLFPDAKVLPKLFPVELLLDFVDNEAAHVMTFTSHSVNSMKAKDKIEFDDSYLLGDFRQLHVCFVASNFARCFDNRKICLYRCNDKIFINWGWDVEDLADVDEKKPLVAYAGVLDEYFVTTVWKNVKRVGGCLIFHEMSSAVASFLADKEYSLIARDVFIKRLDDKLAEIEKERLYFLVPKCKVSYVQKIHLQRELRYSKEEVKVEELTEEELEIAMLKGVLEATEKRLEAALKENMELKIEIERQLS